MTFVSFSGQSVLTFLAPCSPNLVFFFSSQNLILPPFLESLPVLHFSSAMRCARHIPGESHWCLVQKPLVFVWFTLLTITYFSKSALWTTDKHQAVFYYTSVQVTFFFFKVSPVIYIQMPIFKNFPNEWNMISLIVI